MLFHVVAGRRGFSEKTFQRLLECEVAAGVRSEISALLEQGLRGTDLMAALLHGEGEGQSEVAIEDIDAGSKEVPALTAQLDAISLGHSVPESGSAGRNSACSAL